MSILTADSTPSDDSEFVQRRDAFRLSIRLRARVERPVQHTCETVNLSVLGALLDSPLPGVRLGDDITMLLDLRPAAAVALDLSDTETVELDAIILRCTPAGTAVVFNAVTQETTKALQRFIAAEQRRLLRLARGTRR